MLLVLDNYDSFTWNLVQLAGELGAAPVVRRNDAIGVDEAMEMADAIIVSPGPGTPERAGISIPLVQAALDHRIPLLGVCLGHQAIAAALGARIVRADRLMHGKTTRIHHSGTGVFAGLADPLEVMRYHSLLVAPDSLPPALEVTAWAGDRDAGTEIMAVAHRDAPVHGVQFHPESVASEGGRSILENFLSLAGTPAVRAVRAPA